MIYCSKQALPIANSKEEADVTNMLQPVSDPVIDQVFITEPGDGGEESDVTCIGDNYHDREARLQKEYEAVLMRELKGTI